MKHTYPVKNLIGRFRAKSAFPKGVLSLRPIARFKSKTGFVNFHKSAPVLGRIGNLEVRLVRSAAEIKKAQRLRYEVFYEELNAIADKSVRSKRRDIDSYDEICDHLIVLDTSKKNRPIVATYRLLRQEIANKFSGFYSSGEFAIDPLLATHQDMSFLELGRSCVLKEYRNKRTIELLWQGTWAYILQHKIDVLFGCASFRGTDLEALSAPLSFLHHTSMAQDDWQVRPLPHLEGKFDLINEADINMRNAMRELPPLIKGYLRLGAKTSKGVVVDHQFGTTDVMIILQVRDINPAYVNYYGADASRYAV